MKKLVFGLILISFLSTGHLLLLCPDELFDYFPDIPCFVYGTLVHTDEYLTVTDEFENDYDEDPVETDNSTLACDPSELIPFDQDLLNTCIKRFIFTLGDKNATKVYAIENDNTTLKCRSENLHSIPSTLSVEYKYNQTQQPRVLTTGNGYEVSNQLMSWSNLITVSIPTVVKERSGEYTCGARSKSDASIVEILPLLMTVLEEEAPKILKTFNHSENVGIEPGKINSIYCNVTGRPSPYIFWTKDGERIRNNEIFTIADHGRLLIIQANKTAIEVEGKYECNATNRISSDSLPYTVTFIEEEINDDDTESIVLGVILPICLLTILVVTIICIKNRQREKKERKELEMFSKSLFNKGQLELYNPDLSLGEQVNLLPYDEKYEFPSNRLKLGKILGQGAFGRVRIASAIGIEAKGVTTTVAVKMLKEGADLSAKLSLASELKILIHLGKHLNIVNLLGAVTVKMNTGELYVIVEYCRYGNLRDYLLRLKSHFVNQIDPETGIVNRILTALPKSENIDNKSSPDNAKNEKLENVHNEELEMINVDFSDKVKSTVLEKDKTAAIAKAKEAESKTNSESEEDCDDQTIKIEIVDSIGERESLEKEDLENFPLNTSELLCFSFQCARGMEYLESRKLIHRDLAARNVLLTNNRIVKICDFGLAKDIYNDTNYTKKTGGPKMPIKWMAIESLTDKVYTSKSDVWSYGIFLWELFSLGGDPYPATDINQDFYIKLKNGYRMEKPDFCPNNVYEVMTTCWDADPDKRPNFQSLSVKLGNILGSGVSQYYLDLNIPYNNLNVLAIGYLDMDGKDADGYLKMVQNPLYERKKNQYQKLNVLIDDQMKDDVESNDGESNSESLNDDPSNKGLLHDIITIDPSTHDKVPDKKDKNSTQTTSL